MEENTIITIFCVSFTITRLLIDLILCVKARIDDERWKL